MQREVRERKKKEDEREREEEREEVPLLSLPTLPPVIFCAHISLRRRHHLKAWNSRRTNLRSAVFFFLTETRSADLEKGEEEGTSCCFFSFGFVAVVPLH